MDEPKTLADFLRVSAELTVEEFVSRFGSPFLIASGVLGGTMTPGRARVETWGVQLDDGLSHAPSARNPEAGSVYLVRKRMRTSGPDASRVTVGRAPDRDILISEASVSNVHCHFEREGEALLVSDASSRNGTFVNRKRLGAGERTPVKDGDLVTFGRVSYQLFGPAALYFELKAFREGSV